MLFDICNILAAFPENVLLPPLAAVDTPLSKVTDSRYKKNKEALFLLLID